MQNYQRFLAREKKINKIENQIEVLEKKLQAKRQEHQLMVNQIKIDLLACSKRVRDRVETDLLPRLKKMPVI